MTKRQCTRGLYDGKPLNGADLKALEMAGSLDGVECLLLTADSGPKRPPIMVEGGHRNGDCGQQVMAA